MVEMASEQQLKTTETLQQSLFGCPSTPISYLPRAASATIASSSQWCTRILSLAQTVPICVPNYQNCTHPYSRAILLAILTCMLCLNLYFPYFLCQWGPILGEGKRSTFIYEDRGFGVVLIGFSVG